MESCFVEKVIYNYERICNDIIVRQYFSWVKVQMFFGIIGIICENKKIVVGSMGFGVRCFGVLIMVLLFQLCDCGYGF